MLLVAGRLGLLVILAAPERLHRVLEHAKVEFLQLQIDRHRVGPEEVVVERLVAVYPLPRIECQQFLEQIEAVRVFYVGTEALLESPLQIGLQLHLRVQLELFHVGPDVGRYRAAYALYELDLVLLRVALENGLARPQLGHDAAGTPHVDRLVVAAFAEQKLRRSIPKCHHSVRVPTSFVLEFLLL